jgi:hypothetical protein
MPNSRIRRLAAAAVLAAALAAPSAANAADAVYGAAIGTGATATTGVLDVAGGSTSLGAKVIQYPATNGSNQRWNLIPLSGDRIQIVSQKSGMCLTTSGVVGQQLYLWTCNGGTRQEWVSNAGPINWYVDAHYGDIYNPTTGLTVAVDGGSGLAGTRIIGWYDNNTASQDFAYYLLG